jgi:hypothetical protein
MSFVVADATCGLRVAAAVIALSERKLLRFIRSVIFLYPKTVISLIIMNSPLAWCFLSFGCTSARNGRRDSIGCYKIDDFPGFESPKRNVTLVRPLGKLPHRGCNLVTSPSAAFSRRPQSPFHGNTSPSAHFDGAQCRLL